MKFVSAKIRSLWVTYASIYGITFTLQSLFDLNTERKKVVRSVKEYTHVNYPRLSGLWDIAEKCCKDGVEGSFVECGTWKGGCAGIMAHVSKKYGYPNDMYFFDSFEGLPKPRKEDGAVAIEFADGDQSGALKTIGKVDAGEEYIKELLFEKLEIDPSYVEIVKGWFQDTLPVYRKKIKKIAILRLDGDWYESTKVALENLYDLVVSGGYVVIDDYKSWEGCKLAVDEFIKERGLKIKMKQQDLIGTYFIKP